MPARRVSMIARLYRPLLMSLVPLGLIACATSPPTLAEQDATVPLGIDLGGSGPVIATAQSEAAEAAPAGHEVPPHGDEMQMAHAGQNDAHALVPSIRSTPPSTRSISATNRS